jgi:hypothetical protein
MNLLAWQQDFLDTIQSYENCVVNLYGQGGEGKTFLANVNKDSDTQYVHYDGESIPKRTTKRLVIISNLPLRRFVNYNATKSCIDY